MKTYLIIFISLIAWTCHPASQKAASSATSAPDIVIRHLDSSNFDMCRMTTCPPVEIRYLEITNPNDPWKSINDANRKRLIDLILEYQEEEDGLRTPEAAVAGFIREYLNFKQEHPNSVAVYEASVDQDILSRDSRAFIIETRFHFYTGGAHGIYGTRFQNFDAKTGRSLSNSDLISDIPAFTNYAEKAFRKKHGVPSGERLTDHGFFFKDDIYVLPENIAVTSDQVILLYNPYEAASYAQGQIRLGLPKKEVRKWLNY